MRFEMGCTLVLAFICCRTAKDFASASDKIWGHFAALGLARTQKQILVQMGIIKRVSTFLPMIMQYYTEVLITELKYLNKKRFPIATS